MSRRWSRTVQRFPKGVFKAVEGVLNDCGVLIEVGRSAKVGECDHLQAGSASLEGGDAKGFVGAKRHQRVVVVQFFQ